MKIVHAASELFPYVKTGGLADAVASLAGALADRGHEVAVFLPGYRGVVEHPDAAEAETVLRPRIEMGDVFMSGEIRRFQPREGLTVYLVCRDEFFDRSHPMARVSGTLRTTTTGLSFSAKAWSRPCACCG